MRVVWGRGAARPYASLTPPPPLGLIRFDELLKRTERTVIVLFLLGSGLILVGFAVVWLLGALSCGCCLSPLPGPPPHHPHRPQCSSSTSLW